MTAAIIIPARYGSTRFPGKPLHKVAGMAMIERVWRIAKAVRGATRIVIATDDERIRAAAAGFGAEAVMTPQECANGTERSYAALAAAKIDEDILLNLQGDALLTPPWVLEALIAEMTKSPDVEMVTPATMFSDAGLESFREHKKTAPASGTSVVFDRHFDALYFSKLVLPFMRKAGAAPVYRHVGLYGFRRRGLERYIKLPPTPLEAAEGLEQLRALENGMKIRVVPVDYKGRTHGSIDAPEDVPVIEGVIAREGELVAR